MGHRTYRAPALRRSEIVGLDVEDLAFLLRELVGGIGDRSSELVDLCIEVAAASGGFLGMGKRIGEEEKALIAEILTQLGPDAGAKFRDDLGE